MHFCAYDGPSQDTTAYRDLPDEGTFLVCRTCVSNRVLEFPFSRDRRWGWTKILGRNSSPSFPHSLARYITGDVRLTDVCAFNRRLWCPESQSNIFVPSSPSLPDLRALCALDFLVDEDVRLLLKSALRLHRQLGRHNGWIELVVVAVWNCFVGGGRDLPCVGAKTSSKAKWR